MFTILIADDEFVERDGIRFLIDKYGLDLKVVEAENGEKALEYIQKNHVDILFTDIKMPFMDGLELAEKALEIIPRMKVIIFSAYGEFEYAKKAIDISALNYILKPVNTQEFHKVMNHVIELCREELREKDRNEKLMEVYHKNLQYERENVLIDLINGAQVNQRLKSRMQAAGLDYDGQFLRILMIDLQNRFFDTQGEEFVSAVRQMSGWELDYLDLNERQCLLLLKSLHGPIPEEEAEGFAEEVKNHLLTVYGIPACIVVSNSLDGISGISGEYSQVESVLDSKFFFNRGAVLLVRKDRKTNYSAPESIEKILESVKNTNGGNYYNTLKTIELLLGQFAEKEEFSVIYVKYLCAEIIRKAFEPLSDSTPDFKEWVERIFKSGNLDELRGIVQAAAESIGKSHGSMEEDNTKKAIQAVKKLVDMNYMQDISLEWVAEKVYLAPTYLSHLFKKETGQSLIKYLTNYRLEKARELLTNTNIKINDIAGKVGYQNASYFSLIFKSYFGVTPARYREEEMEWNGS